MKSTFCHYLTTAIREQEVHFQNRDEIAKKLIMQNKMLHASRVTSK